MTRISKLSYQETAKAKISARFKQLLVLVLSVIIGMLISVSVNAQGAYKKQNDSFFKTRCKTQNIQGCAVPKKKEHNTLATIHGF